jgi:hypothetical protein
MLSGFKGISGALRLLTGLKSIGAFGKTQTRDDYHQRSRIGGCSPDSFCPESGAMRQYSLVESDIYHNLILVFSLSQKAS